MKGWVWGLDYIMSEAGSDGEEQEQGNDGVETTVVFDHSWSKGYWTVCFHMVDYEAGKDEGGDACGV